VNDRRQVIEGYDYSFPVIGYSKDPARPGIVAPKNVYGTAFSIGGGWFMTAAHVLESALSENSTAAIGFVDGPRYIAADVSNYELHPEFDVALFGTSIVVARAKALPWLEERLPGLFDVAATGYPYAIDLQQNTLGGRWFKGYVVSRRKRSVFRARPWTYELSFACPRGLSGSPLITLHEDSAIAGLVVGNHTTKILVFTDSERISETEETIVERYEALQLGVAIESNEILGITSLVLGSTLRVHLQRHSLLQELAD
jgi:hypothetical protein